MAKVRQPYQTDHTTRVTQADVAERAGVSISVVSRELSGDPELRARPETRERIHRAVSELGYTPSHAARSLRLSRAFAVGVVVPDLNNPIYHELVRGIDEVAEELGYHVLMSRTEHMEPGADFLRKLAGEGRVDGFLIQRRDETDQRDFAALADAGGRPIVLMNARWSRHGSVVHDDEGAGRMATQHLLDLGHRDIALIGGDRHSHTAAARERGYLQAIHGAAMRRRSDWVLNRPYLPDAGREAMIDNGKGVAFFTEAKQFAAMLDELISDPLVKARIDDHLEFTGHVWDYEHGRDGVSDSPLMKNYYKNTDASKGIALAEYTTIAWLLHQ